MDIVFWILLGPTALGIVYYWLYSLPDQGPVPESLRRLINRGWGEYSRFARGKLWEPGEQEVCRVRLLGVSAYSVDRHTQIEGKALCIVTNHRVLSRDERGGAVQLRAADIRSVRQQRDYDQYAGFSYWVVLGRSGSAVPESEGDFRLKGAGERDTRLLSSTIQELIAA